MTETETTEQNDETSRRNILVGVVGLGALSAGFGLGGAAGQSNPEGEIGTAANPYLRAHLDEARFIARSSDPSNPDDGTLWYRGDL